MNTGKFPVSGRDTSAAIKKTYVHKKGFLRTDEVSPLFLMQVPQTEQ
jgi:hypothetical protein